MELPWRSPSASRPGTATIGPVPRGTTGTVGLLGSSECHSRPAATVPGPCAGTPHPGQALPCRPTCMRHAPSTAPTAAHLHAGSPRCTRATGHTPDRAPGAGPRAAHTPSATPAAGAPRPAAGPDGHGRRPAPPPAWRETGRTSAPPPVCGTGTCNSQRCSKAVTARVIRWAEAWPPSASSGRARQVKVTRAPSQATSRAFLLGPPRRYRARDVTTPAPWP
jgi:hypothetical protein